MTEQVTDQALLRSTLLANLLDENLTPSSSVNFLHFTVHRGSNVTDSLVQQVCEFNSGIQIINLENCCNDVTDLGVLAIATYCHQLENIKLSDCFRLTQVGVRALALNCPLLKTLSLKRCANIDDRSLRIIAANVRCLEKLELEGCTQVSDCGVSEVAQWCKNLTLINLNSCVKIGEHGDKSLKMMGLKSHMLNHLDLTDCANLPDRAIKSLSCGCRDLSILKLSGCALLTGKSLRNYVSTFANLTVLTLANCFNIQDSDLTFLCQKCRCLKLINVSCSPAITLRSLKAILNSCPKLEELDMSGNPLVDDFMLDAITKGAAELGKLTLHKCHTITEKGIKDLVIKAHNLLHLDLTGCLNIQPLFIYRIASHMPFSNVSQSFLGFEAKNNAAELMLQQEHFVTKNASVSLLQRVVRGFLVRAGEVHKMRTTKKDALVMPIIQALSRGFLGRLRYREELTIARANRGTSLIQLRWRCHRLKQKVSKKICDKETLTRRIKSTASVQRVYRGYCYGRRVTREAKQEKTRRELAEAKRNTCQMMASITIQRSMKCALARKKIKHLKEINRFQIERQKVICCHATVIQKAERCRRSKIIAAVLKEEKGNQKLREKKVTTVQATWRRKRYRQIRYQENERRLKGSALQIQYIWRQHQSNLKFYKFRAQITAISKQKKSAIDKLQRLGRGRAARSIVQRMRLSKEYELLSIVACQKIQRMFQYYLCREKLQVLRDTAHIECRMKVLFPKFQVSTNELQGLDSTIIALTAKVASSEKEISELERELRLMEETGSKYWDSDRISGTPQRFLTSVLYVQMKHILNEIYAGVASTRKTLNALTTERDELRRATEFLRNEISYLNTVALEKAKMERSNQLRSKVKAMHLSALLIQRNIRRLFAQAAL